MRAAAAPLQRVYRCPCGQDHPSVLQLQGVPVLRCPEKQGTALHFIMTDKGVPLLVTGEGASAV